MQKRQKQPRPVTIADVAQAAGVSKATAARALGGYGPVSSVVSERVLDASRRLDYRPNELARTMATGRSGTIGVVVGDIENPFFGLAVRAISDCAKAAGFDVILSNSGERVEDERAAVMLLTAKRVDGLIVAPAAMTHRDHLDAIVARGTPLVLLDRDMPGLEVDAALVDGRAAAITATRLLLDAGHRRMAYVTAAESVPRARRLTDAVQIALSSVLRRIQGFLAVTTEAGLAEQQRTVLLGVNGTEDGQSALTDLLATPDRPTAVLASDSRVALNVFRAAKIAGLTIPRDLSLATFDDADWTSAVDPTVTVVAQPTYDLGSEAARMLIERIAGSAAAPRHRLLQAVPVLRDSIAPPPV